MVMPLPIATVWPVPAYPAVIAEPPALVMVALPETVLSSWLAFSVLQYRVLLPIATVVPPVSKRLFLMKV